MNDNCLRGMRCPSCKNEDFLIITCTSEFEFFDNGTGDQIGAITHDNESPCRCGDCGFVGTVNDFLELTPEEFEEYIDRRIHDCHNDETMLRCLLVGLFRDHNRLDMYEYMDLYHKETKQD